MSTIVDYISFELHVTRYLPDLALRGFARSGELYLDALMQEHWSTWTGAIADMRAQFALEQDRVLTIIATVVDEAELFAAADRNAPFAAGIKQAAEEIEVRFRKEQWIYGQVPLPLPTRSPSPIQRKQHKEYFAARDAAIEINGRLTVKAVANECLVSVVHPDGKISEMLQADRTRLRAFSATCLLANYASHLILQQNSPI